MSGSQVEFPMRGPGEAGCSIGDTLRRENDRLHCFAEIFDPPLAGAERGALSGLRFAVKGNIAVKDRPLTLGLAGPVLRCASAHAGVVARLLSAGAQLVGTTAFDEMCLSSTGSSRRWGQVCNPRDARCSPLGSSAGSACAVAAALVDFALGTDYSGSIRAPAAACAVYGLKLSPRADLSRGAALYDPEIDCPGVLAADAGILRRVLESLLDEGTHALDITTLIIPESALLSRCAASVRAEFEAAAERLKGAFEIRSVLRAELIDEASAARRTLAAFHVEDMCARFKLAPEVLPASALALCALRKTLSLSSYADARRRALALGDELSQLLAPQCALLTPALSGALPPLGAEGQTALQLFMPIANIAVLPALSFPAAPPRPSSSPPGYSLHLVGCARRESALLDAAARIRRHCSG